MLLVERAKDTKQKQLRAVQHALEREPVDIAALKKIAASHGFMTSALRVKAWCSLLGLDIDHLPQYKEFCGPHHDYDIVDKDVDRALWHFMRHEKKRNQLERLQELRDITHALMHRHAFLHYYQGLHDVCSVFLLLAGPSLAFALSERICLGHLREALLPDFQTIEEHLSLIMPLLLRCDAEVWGVINAAEVPPFYALSGVITWMSHDINNIESISRLFDVFISSHPSMPLYVWVAMMMLQRDTILSCSNGMDHLHHTLQHLPRKADIDATIQLAVQLFRAHPIQSIIKSSNLSSVFGKHHSFSRYPFPWCDELMSATEFYQLNIFCEYPNTKKLIQRGKRSIQQSPNRWRWHFISLIVLIVSIVSFSLVKLFPIE